MMIVKFLLGYLIIGFITLIVEILTFIIESLVIRRFDLEDDEDLVDIMKYVENLLNNYKAIAFTILLWPIEILAIFYGLYVGWKESNE